MSNIMPLSPIYWIDLFPVAKPMTPTEADALDIAVARGPADAEYLGVFFHSLPGPSGVTSKVLQYIVEALR